MHKNFRLNNLVEQGILLVPDKIKVSYKLKDTYSNAPSISVFGLKHGQTKPIVLGYETALPDSTCTLYGEMTHLIKLSKQTGILDIWVRIEAIESISRLYNIVGIFDQGIIPIGIDAAVPEMECGSELTLLTFDINNGDTFSWSSVVALNHTYDYGTPTHYRASRYSDFQDTTWQTYTAIPYFTLYQLGENIIYLQLKDASHSTDILSDTIGWHAAEYKVFEDDIEAIVDLAIGDTGSYAFPIMADVSYADSASIETIEVSCPADGSLVVVEPSPPGSAGHITIG